MPLETNLQNLFSSEQSDAELSESLQEIIPNLNHDALVDLALYLSLERKFNAKEVWRAIEAAAYESLHLFSLK